jgi:hypothetical protein
MLVELTTSTVLAQHSNEVLYCTILVQYLLEEVESKPTSMCVSTPRLDRFTVLVLYFTLCVRGSQDLWRIASTNLAKQSQQW